MYFSHPTGTEPRSAWDPTSTCCYPRRGRQWQRSNCPDSRFSSDDGFESCSSCCGSRRYRRRRSHPIPDDADVLSGNLRLLCFYRSARRSHWSRDSPSLSSLPSSPPPSPPRRRRRQPAPTFYVPVVGVERGGRLLGVFLRFCGVPATPWARYPSASTKGRSHKHTLPASPLSASERTVQSLGFRWSERLNAPTTAPAPANDIQQRSTPQRAPWAFQSSTG